jgi:hypothetical protein
MQEYDNIRKKLVNAEAEAPDFDALFGGETLGVNLLHSTLQSKLAKAEINAPDFEELFKGEILGKPARTPKINMLPWWSMASMAAACLAVAFLLPHKLGHVADQLSKAPSVEKIQPKVHITIQTYQVERSKVNAQLLNTPTDIRPLNVEPKNTSVQTAMAVQTEDTAAQETLTKITPTRTSSLLVKSTRSVEEAYADARIRKSRIKPDKTTLGFGLNSANRLLSMVNSKSDASFALQSVASSASDGYASLEGASTSMLRTTTTSPNEWIGPDNITAAMLQNCETNYSMPVNLGLTVSIPIIHDLNLITGIQYTYLSNHITGSTFDLKQELHYLGIPVKLAVNLVKRGEFIIYTALGGTVEKGLAGIQTSKVDGEGIWKGTQSIEGFQTSLTGQFGVSYNLNTNFLLYFEPGVAWYIPSDQPVSNRTEEPFNFNLSLGLRYRLQ